MPIGRNRGTTPAELLAEIRRLRARGQAAGETNAKQIQKEIEGAVDFLIGTTVKGNRLLAQHERQTQHAIRGGGAPNYRGEAVQAIREAKEAWQHALGSSKEERKAAVARAVAAVKNAIETAPGKLALTFRDGFTCIYTSSNTADYINIIAAGSKGRWVWARGWGPVGHPSYLETTIDPARVIDQQPVLSSWVAYAYLLED